MEIDNGNPNEASDRCLASEGETAVGQTSRAQASRDRQHNLEGIPFWQRIANIGAQVPKETWESLPKDFARNGDHYLYGTPKDE